MKEKQANQESRELQQFEELPEMINAQDVKDVIGNWGRVQMCLLIAVAIINIPAAWNNLGMPFMAPNIDHWCARPEEYSNMSVEQWKNLTIPHITENGKLVYNKCYMYDIKPNHSSSLENNGTKIPCVSWEYDHSFYQHTLIDKWDLVCNQSWLPSLAGSMYFIGFMISVSVMGQLSDSYGRKLMMLLSMTWALVLGIMCAFSTTFWMFAVCRLLLALGRASSFLCLYIILMEMTGNKERTMVALVDNLSWDFAQMLLPGFDWLVRDWFYIQLVSILPYVILLVCLWFAPESPRWLLSQGRIADAEKTIERICKLNGRQIQNLGETVNVIAKNVTEEDERQGGKKTFLDIIKSPVLRRNSFVLYSLWIILAFSYYALTFTTEDVGGNVHLFFVLSALVGIPSVFLYFYMQYKVGRKYPLLIFMIVTGVTCLLAIAVPHEQSGWIIGLTVFSKFCMSISFISVYLLATEIYPTVVRAVGLGSCSMMARIGAIVAPFMKEGASNVHWSFPLIIVGSASILGSLLSMLLPETKDMNLTDTLNQGEKLKTESGKLRCLQRRKKKATN